MWVSIEIIPCSDEVIYLPKPMVDRFNSNVNISFGKRTVSAKVEPADDIEMTEGRVFEEPQTIRISSGLAYRLQILTTLTYQMKFNRGNIMIGPVIGLLLGRYNHLYSPSHMEKYSDRFGIYNTVGGLIYVFSPRTIDWRNLLAYGMYYNYKKSAWQYGKFPLPSAIYRRDFHSDPEDIKRLIDITDGKMFNSWRFSKFYLYQHARKDRELSKHLPPTALSRNFLQIKRFIDNYNDVILKPIGLSRGRGICIIKKEGDIYKVSDYRRKEPVELEIDGNEALERFFKANKSFFNRYLVQRHLKLAKIEESLFDIRVVMQKEKPSEWKCTGIECRVAAPKNLLTNISRGGYALTIDEALERAFPEEYDSCGQIKEELDDLCYKLCQSFDKIGQHFGEFGMDIAVDKDKNLWIIEVNVFPSFKGFKKMNYRTYLDIRHTPILYAAHLAGFSQYHFRGEYNE